MREPLPRIEPTLSPEPSPHRREPSLHEAPSQISPPARAPASSASTPASAPSVAPSSAPRTPAGRFGLRFWIVTVAAAATLASTVALGRWQLSRAHQKEALAASIAAQQALPPLSLPELLAAPDPRTQLHRIVQLRGLWLPSQTVYLDNRQMHGRPGFFVLTPLAIEDTELTLMVQRGWIPRNFQDRTALSPVETPPGLVDITARVAAPPAQLFQLGKEATSATPSSAPTEANAPASPADRGDSATAAETPGASRIRQNLDLHAFRAETGLPLREDFSLQQVGAASEGLDREWTAPALGIEKHYGYAFQWFGLATLVTLLYAWFQLIAPRRRRRS